MACSVDAQLANIPLVRHETARLLETWRQWPASHWHGATYLWQPQHLVEALYRPECPALGGSTVAVVDLGAILPDQEIVGQAGQPLAIPVALVIAVKR